MGQWKPAPSREFLYVDDAVRALLLAGEHLQTSQPVYVGTGVETRIRDLADMIGRFTEYQGELVWDASKPDGQPTRCLDVSRARELMGFQSQVGLEEGLQKTVEWFREVGDGVSLAERPGEPSVDRA